MKVLKSFGENRSIDSRFDAFLAKLVQAEICIRHIEAPFSTKFKLEEMTGAVGLVNSLAGM